MKNQLSSPSVNKPNLKAFLINILINFFFLISIIINIFPFLSGRAALNDFGSFYASGLKAQNGENPYSGNSNFIFNIRFSRVNAGGVMINLNPPISVLIFQILSRFDPYEAMRVLQFISVILYICVIFLLIITYKENTTPTKFVWAFTLAGFSHTIGLGQIYVFLLLFTILGWLLLRNGKFILAGIAIGLVITIKPNFIIWPIFLLMSGYYMTFIVSILSCLIISIIPIVLYGPQIYIQWLQASSLRFETLIMPGNNSILGLTARFHDINSGLAISGIFFLTLLFMSKYKRTDLVTEAEYISALGIVGSLFASPISWTGYTLLLLPIFFSIRKWSYFMLASATILSIPFAFVSYLFQRSALYFVLFGWLYGWAIVLITIELIKMGKLKQQSRLNKQL